jgi:ribosomal protein S18 acetylase RimI-like enzyme
MEKDLFREIEKLEKEIIGAGRSRIYTYTVGPDSMRAAVLTELGFEDRGLHEYNHEFPKDASIPDNPLPEGYRIRSLRGEEDYAQYIGVIGSVYDHCRDNMTMAKMRFMAEADFYHHDLNLVVTDGDDTFVAFCMYRFDPTTSIAEMELLGTRPGFENLGLEEALLSEGLRRVLKYRPNLVCAVEVDVSDPLNQMLESAGFVRSVTMNQWWKMIEGKGV